MEGSCEHPIVGGGFTLLLYTRIDAGVRGGDIQVALHDTTIYQAPYEITPADIKEYPHS